MLPDGSVRVSVDCDVPAATLQSASTKKPTPWKGKARAPPKNCTVEKLKPNVYMSFLMQFIRKQLFIRNTKDTIVDDYNVPQVMTRS